MQAYFRVRQDVIGRPVLRLDELPDGPEARNLDCGIDLADALGIEPGYYHITVRKVSEDEIRGATEGR